MIEKPYHGGDVKAYIESETPLFLRAVNVSTR